MLITDGISSKRKISNRKEYNTIKKFNEARIF